MKLVLNEPTQPTCDPLSDEAIKTTTNATDNRVEDESDDGSVGSKKPLRKRKSQRNANNNDEERPARDESPETMERNELAKILFNSKEKKFKRNFDLSESNECK